jgi:hypothetical protein
VPHRAAGLRVGAFDLFEVVKYLPGVRSGEVSLLREGFLVPLLVSAALLALAPAVWKKAPRAARWALPLAAGIVAAVALPPYPQITTAYHDPEYRGQLILSGATICLALLSGLTRRLPHRVRVSLLGLLAIVGMVIPLAQYANVRGLFVDLFNAPVGFGWGAIVYLAGMVFVLASATSGFLIPD